MGGRFGKYGDLKRKAALRKSRKETGRRPKNSTPKSLKRRKRAGLSYSTAITTGINR